MPQPNEKHVILFYNYDISHGFHFDVPDIFFITNDLNYLELADVVVFHIPSLGRNESVRKRVGQLWVFWSMEYEGHVPELSNPGVKALFDIYMTYKQDADVIVPYLTPALIEGLREKPQQKESLVNAFISSGYNLSNREAYLKELMSLTEVHSYGRLFNNRTIENDSGPGTKHKIISTYKFTLAFENAIAKDYVTEKFYEPLLAGSVPVYLGAPNIEEFAPGDKCYINVNSFPSVQHLANYLLLLNDNDELYQEYLLWKTRPFRATFLQKLETLHLHPFERLFTIIRERMPHKAGIDQ